MNGCQRLFNKTVNVFYICFLVFVEPLITTMPCHKIHVALRYNSESTTHRDKIWCFAICRHIKSWNRCLADCLGMLEIENCIKHSVNTWQIIKQAKFCKKQLHKLKKVNITNFGRISNGWWVLLYEGLSNLESVCFVLI